MLLVSLSRLQHAKPDELAELRQDCKSCNVDAFSLSIPWALGRAVFVEAEVDRWHALCSMRFG